MPRDARICSSSASARSRVAGLSGSRPSSKTTDHRMSPTSPSGERRATKKAPRSPSRVRYSETMTVSVTRSRTAAGMSRASSTRMRRRRARPSSLKSMTNSGCYQVAVVTRCHSMRWRLRCSYSAASVATINEPSGSALSPTPQEITRSPGRMPTRSRASRRVRFDEASRGAHRFLQQASPVMLECLQIVPQALLLLRVLGALQATHQILHATTDIDFQ